jgi:lysophospholipase L1-like esterase
MAQIYVLGDSHTGVLGPILAKRLGARYEAFSGYSTARAHAAAHIPSGQDVVAISLGGNDFGDQSAARAALVAEVRQKNPGAQVVWFGPFHSTSPGTDARHNQQAEAQRRQAGALGVSWIDTRHISNVPHTADGVHFTGTSYAKIGAFMESELREMLGSGWSWAAAIGALGLWWFLWRQRR